MANLKTYVPFENGQHMPIVGLGTWQVSCFIFCKLVFEICMIVLLIIVIFLKASDEEVKKAVHYALEAGYRHIDTAYNYFNEGAIGEVLQDWFQSGKLKREELFVTTKVSR